MNKFELSAYGVEEMNEKELECIDGGGLTILTALGIAASVVAIASGLIYIYDYLFIVEKKAAYPDPFALPIPKTGTIQMIASDSIVVSGPFGGTYKLYGDTYLKVNW